MKNMNFIKAIVVCSFVLLSGIVLAQNGMKDIKGTICDESGEPIIGASVIVKGHLMVLFPIWMVNLLCRYPIRQ